MLRTLPTMAAKRSAGVLLANLDCFARNMSSLDDLKTKFVQVADNRRRVDGCTLA